MTFADALAKRVGDGTPLPVAIPLAARDAGLTSEPTLRDVQAARAQHPNSFPLHYRRVSLR